MNTLFNIVVLFMVKVVPLDVPVISPCAIHVADAGGYVTFQGVVTAANWSHGNYDMMIESRQGGNMSLSRQSGAFDVSAQAEDGAIILSATTVRVGDGGQVIVRLSVRDETRSTTCSREYKR
ncbi:MAG: hypothetical protein IKD58_07475 [Loktanella sp.]|nr:hypothetical protein [Loktanella sp.]